MKPTATVDVDCPPDDGCDSVIMTLPRACGPCGTSPSSSPEPVPPLQAIMRVSEAAMESRKLMWARTCASCSESHVRGRCGALKVTARSLNVPRTVRIHHRRAADPPCLARRELARALLLRAHWIGAALDRRAVRDRA